MIMNFILHLVSKSRIEKWNINSKIGTKQTDPFALFFVSKFELVFVRPPTVTVVYVWVFIADDFVSGAAVD